MAEKVIEIPNTLVKYNNPVLVIKQTDKKIAADKKVRDMLKII